MKQFLSPSPLPPLTLRASPSDATKTMLQFFKCQISLPPLHSSMSYYKLELSKCSAARFGISIIARAR